MLFDKTNNKSIINIFNILCEVFIGFSVFAIFFGIFMSYYFTEHQTELLGKFINKSVSFYKISITPQISSLLSSSLSSLLTNSFNNLEYKKQLQKSVSEDDKKVSKHNKPYDELLMKIIFGMIIVLLFIIIIPLLLGIIRLEQISFKHIGFSTILHIILIVGFELLFLLFIITYFNSVKLYSVFQHNKNQTGNFI